MCLTMMDAFAGGALPKHKVGVKRPATTGAKERAARRAPAATKTAEDERKVCLDGRVA